MYLVCDSSVLTPVPDWSHSRKRGQQPAAIRTQLLDNSLYAATIDWPEIRRSAARSPSAQAKQWFGQECAAADGATALVYGRASLLGGSPAGKTIDTAPPFGSAPRGYTFSRRHLRKEHDLFARGTATDESDQRRNNRRHDARLIHELYSIAALGVGCRLSACRTPRGQHHAPALCTFPPLRRRQSHT